MVAVKPNQAAKVAEKLNASGLRADTLVISVLAGVSTEKLQGLPTTGNPVIRAMPNTPCLVGHGVTVYCGGVHALPEHLTVAEKILHSVGKALEVEEHYFNAITAL